MNTPPPSSPAAASPLQVACPTCRKKAIYSGNPWRPFCCERCKQIDMGAWAAEDYRVQAAPPPEDLDERES